MANAKYKFTAVSGYFEHDSIAPSRASRISTAPRLGLIDRPFGTDGVFDPAKENTLWERFEHFLRDLNRKEAGRAEYKLFFLARHGEGYHNVQEAKVGTEAWDTHWSKLEGDGTVSWADADLTPTGQGQARTLNAFWRAALIDDKIPAPEKYYVSPHSRTLETCKLSLSGLAVPADRPFRPVVKEMLRERYGEHTCDRRRSRSWITDNYPDFDIEAGLTETDALWTAEAIEEPEHVSGRMTRMLADVFQNDEDKTFVSFTMHSWAIFALHLAVGHDGVWVTPGSMVPLLVRAEKVGEGDA